jgi:hypothetical protein
MYFFVSHLALAVTARRVCAVKAILRKLACGKREPELHIKNAKHSLHIHASWNHVRRFICCYVVHSFVFAFLSAGLLEVNRQGEGSLRSNETSCRQAAKRRIDFQRFAALRSGGFRSTTLSTHHKC